MPSFVALGCLEVGEKFTVVGGGVGWGGGGISIPTTKSQSWAVTKINCKNI